MIDGQERSLQIDERMEPAHGFHELGMHEEAWIALDDLSPEDKAHPNVILLRLDILLALHRLDDAVALGTGACRQWPAMDEFFLKTATALIDLSDHGKAKDLLLAGPPSIQRHAVYWYDLACCQCKLGEVDGAKKSISECFNLDKKRRMQALHNPDLEAVWVSL
jgi:predicted Zn-dependent protease